VTMPSAEFSRICKDIANFGDTVTIDVNKSAVYFSAQGDIGTGKMQLKATTEIDALVAPKKKEEPKSEAASPKKEEQTKPEIKKEAESPEKTMPESNVPEKAKKESESPEKSAEPKEEGATVKTEEADGETSKDKDEEKKDGDAKPPAKRRRTEEEKQAEKDKKEAEKKEKDQERLQKKADKEQEKEEEERRKKLLQAVRIKCEDPVQLQFALRYLTMFSKAQSVSDVVTMRLARDTPMIMEFPIELPSKSADAPAGNADDERLGSLQYYLAPKVGDGDDEGEAPAAGAANDE